MPARYIWMCGLRVSFELALASRTRCTIHACDPTVGRLPLPPGVPLSVSSRIRFHKLGLRGRERKSTPSRSPLDLATLDEAMARVGIRHAHLLKIDIDGDEYDALAQAANAGTLLRKVDQLQLEIHLQQMHTNRAGAASGVRRVFELFNALERSQLLPFSWESNHHPAGSLGQRPGCIEYGFRRPRGLSRSRIESLLQMRKYGLGVGDNATLSKGAAARRDARGSGRSRRREGRRARAQQSSLAQQDRQHARARRI